MKSIKWPKLEATTIQGICVKCNKNKQTNRGKDKYHSRCYSCLHSKEYLEKKYARAKAHPNYLINRNKSSKRTGGISKLIFDQMILIQNNKCLICEMSPNGFHKTLHVDHDHETGKVRGLLCHHCNTMLGLARDSPKTLASAIDYLKRNQ